MYDHDSKVPLIVVAPGVAGNQTCDRPVELIDLYPTLMELIGAPAPAGLDGQSLAPLLQNPTLPFKPAICYREVGNSPVPMVRTDQYKFVYWPDSGLHELYDMIADPGEYTNLYGDPAYDSVVQNHLSILQQEGLLNCAAGFAAYGSGTAGTLGVPGLTLLGPPILGSPVTLSVGNSLGLASPAFSWSVWPPRVFLRWAEPSW